MLGVLIARELSKTSMLIVVLESFDLYLCLF